MYQTNFIIIFKELKDRINKVLIDKCQYIADKLLESLSKNENEIRKIGLGKMHPPV